MLSAGLIIVAIVLRAWGTGSYLKAVWRRDARPSIVSWSLWAVAQGLAFAAQVSEPGDISWQAWSMLGLGLGSLAIVSLAIARGSFGLLKPTLPDGFCALFALVGLAGLLVYDKPAVVLSCSICADLAAGLPTIIKALRDPASEHKRTYALSFLAAVATLASIKHEDWVFTTFAFHAYLVGVNLLMVSILAWKRPAASNATPTQAPALVDS
jgi:hypothetical protein